MNLELHKEAWREGEGACASLLDRAARLSIARGALQIHRFAGGGLGKERKVRRLRMPDALRLPHRKLCSFLYVMKGAEQKLLARVCGKVQNETLQAKTVWR